MKRAFDFSRWGSATVVSLLLCWSSALTGVAAASLPIEQWTLPSGAKVHLVQTRNLPMVDVQIDLDAGSRRDPPERSGLAAAAAGQLASGVRALPAAVANSGVALFPSAMDENALGEAWADLGASFGATVSADRLTFTLRSLTDPSLLPRALALAARQMAHPAFPEAIWQRDRERWVASWREARTRPGTVVQERFDQAVFGAHPYGQRVTPETLGRIAVGDLQRWHQSALRTCRAVVSVVGDLDRAQATALVTQLLAHWPQGPCEFLPVLPEPAALTAAQELRIPMASAQAHVRVGQPGYPRRDPDFFPLLVGNHILGGGGFTSRLTHEVREKRGLSYSVYSYFAPGLNAGAFTVGLQTRPDQVDQAVGVVRSVLRDFVAQGPTEAELRAAKDNLVGGFALRIDSNRKLLDNVANIAWNELPIDYLSTWTAQVERVTQADVRRAMARVLQPERMVTVVVGGQQAAPQ